MKRYNQLLNYIGKNYSSFFFISIFYSLWLIFKYASAFNPELHSFPGRMIGEATLQGYDVGIRVAAFYKAGALFFFSNLFLSVIAWRIAVFSTEFFKTPEIKIINYTSIAGIVLWFFTLYGSQERVSLELIYCIHKTMIVALVVKRLILKNKNNSSLINISWYSIAFVIAVSVFFLLNEWSVLFNAFPKANFLFVLSITVILGCFFTALFITKKPLLLCRAKLNTLAFLMVPLAIIPLLSFLKDESYLILNKHQICHFSPRSLYALSLILPAMWILWRTLKTKKNPGYALANNTAQLVGKRFFPLLVLSISTFTFYSPFMQASTEMFEAGNEFLPIMEFKKFGVIPIIEKFNAHELKDFFFGGIYAFFNGLNGREMQIYNIFLQVIWAVLVYFFIFKLTRNPYVALYLIILLPITDALLPGYHIMALLAIFVINMTINKAPSIKIYLTLFFSFLFLGLWRVDMGYAAIIAAFAVLAFYRINKLQSRFDTFLFLKAFGIFTCFLLLALVAISVWRNINIIDKFSQALNYLASAQTYGYSIFGDFSDSVFKMHYFVFPLLILLGLGAMAVCFHKYTVSKFQRFVYIAFLFLAVYYFVNFQRGLIRHSFAEGHDTMLSSFFFFISGANVYLFFFKKAQLYKFIVFLSVTLVLMLNYKVPHIRNPQNFYSSFYKKAKQFPAIIPAKNFNRSPGDTEFEENRFGKIKKFIGEKLNENQTFIDFTNSPMLYYFTGKISPSYFYQNPLTIHNDYLQKKFIAGLVNYDAPIIVFSQFPENIMDKVDEVPNVLRHYRIAEYFYNHYQPFGIIDGYCLWKRNDFNLKNTQKLIFEYSSQNMDSINNIKPIITGNISSAPGNYVFKVTSGLFSGNQEENLITIHSPSSEINIHPDYVDGPTKTGYYFYSSSEKFSFFMNNKSAMVQSFLVYAADYFPDVYSSRTKGFDVKLLPFIWGTYDKQVHEEKILADLVIKPKLLEKNKGNFFNFPATIDKSSGNTILVALQCDNESPLPVELLYYSRREGNYKGSFQFTIPKGQGEREFAIRISSHYNWYNTTVDSVVFWCFDFEGIKINRLKILKGN